AIGLGAVERLARTVGAVELLDGLVQRGAVDHRVVRGRGNANNLAVLVSERAGQVRVERRVAQGELSLDRPATPPWPLRRRLRGRDPLQGPRGVRRGREGLAPETGG